MINAVTLSTVRTLITEIHGIECFIVLLSVSIFDLLLVYRREKTYVIAFEIKKDLTEKSSASVIDHYP